MSFKLSEKADSDLVYLWYDIALVTQNPDFADNYLDQFETEFVKLSKNPMIGESRGYLVEGFRKWTFKKYIIYYSVHSSYIRVERIIWGKKDQKKAFQS